MEVVTVPGLQRTADWFYASLQSIGRAALRPGHERKRTKKRTESVRNVMKALARLGIIGSVVFTVSSADAATITGTVKGPDGQAFRGAFVQARNAKTKITVNVLSDNQGRYRAENLAAGDYRLQIRAPGYQADTVNALALTQDQNATQDFALKASYVRWTDISMYQGIQLLPEERGKNLFFIHCMACHGYETRMAAVKSNEDGWRDRVNYMRESMAFFIARPQLGFNDQKAEDVVSYINHVFGEESVLPRSPAELPQYNETVRKFADDAL